MSIFNYVEFKDEIATKHVALHNSFKAMEVEIQALLKDGRAKSLSLTKLEEAFMWTGKALKDEQLFINVGKEVENKEQK